MKIDKLKWDSEFFGIKIGQLVITEENMFDPIQTKKQAIEENYDLIYVIKYAKMLTWEKAIKADLELADIIITMSKKFDKNEYKDVSYDFRTELSKEELIECYKIAEQTAIVSRFYKETKIGIIKTNELYRKWIDNTLNKSIADGLLIVKEANSIVGIHLIKTDEKNKIGLCSIIGVNSNYKGLGIGKKLWKQAFGYWANEKKIEYCIVPFSLQNSDSFNFHLKIGFNKIEEIKYIYHYRNNITK